MLTFNLATRCPRLALARDQRIRELTLERDERHFVRDKLESAERCVAHRHLARSHRTRNGRYIDMRRRKLVEAERKLAGIQRWADTIGALA